MKKRLLIIVSRLLQGGIETILIEYLKQFDRNKFSIRLAVGICMEEQETCIKQVPYDVPVSYLVKNHFLIKYRKQKSFQKLPFLKKSYDEVVLNPIRRVVQQTNLNRLIEDSDIVIDFDSTFYSFLKNSTIPKIAFFHFSFKKYHNGHAQKLKRLGGKLNTYDKIVTICNEMREEGIEMFPNLQDKFITIYNAFDFDAIEKKSMQPINSPLAGFPYILAVQRLEESQKDLTTLIKAYKILIDRHKITENLYIIGEGKSREQLTALCRESGLENRIYFLGLQANPYPWIRKSELFVLSSKFEGLPTVLIEALSLEKAIVSTNCPTGPSEILDNGNAGVLVPIEDENSMAEAILLILTDTSYKNQMLNGVRKQKNKFDINNTIKKIEDLALSL